MNKTKQGLLFISILGLFGAASISGFAQNAPATAPKAPAVSAPLTPAPPKPAPAAAATPAAKLKTAVIAVVDAQTMLEKSDAAKSAQVKLEAIAADLQKKITAEEDALKNEQKALQSQQTILSPDAFAKKQQDLQKKFTDLEAKVTEARRWLSTTRDGVGRYITNALIEVVGKLAEERGVDIVIPSSQILYTTASLNLTTEVLARLNKRLPDVPITPISLKDAADVKP
jgi:outer membrane protein